MELNSDTDWGWMLLSLAAGSAGRDMDERIDCVYAGVEELIHTDVQKLDVLLLDLDPSTIAVEEVVAFLIATLSIKDKLEHRTDFVNRAKKVIPDLEVFRGLG